MFYLATAWALLWLRPRPAVVVTLTTPPYIGLLSRLVGALRRWRRVPWIMDLYPDVMLAHGMLQRRGVGRTLASVFGWLTRREYGGAAMVLTLGPDMAERCRRYVSGRTPVAWVPLWAAEPLLVTTDADGDRLRRQRGWPPDELVLMYSGNMGLGHRFDEFLKAAAEAGPGSGAAGRRRWVFAGGGRRRSQVVEFAASHPDARIQLMPYVEYAEMAPHLRSADVLLASMESKWAGCMVPSKIQGMMATGRPTLFVGPRDCALGRWLEAAGGGWVVAPGDSAGLEKALREAADPQTRHDRGERARAFARAHFGRDINCGQIAEWLEHGPPAVTPPA